MLREAEVLQRYALGAEDGEIGKIEDVYFDDRAWTVRYLVAGTGNWLSERLVLISPHAVAAVDGKHWRVATKLMRKQIGDSPVADSDKPVSRQFETVYRKYYGWPDWGTLYQLAAYETPSLPMGAPVEDEESSWDPHLRSISEVKGYKVDAVDGEIGHIADFLLDDEEWTIRYMVVDTRDLWPGKHVLMSPEWIERVSWEDGKVYVDLSREAIKNAPVYAPGASVSRDYEAELCRHYGREGYWSRAGCALGPGG
jgi:hypothetical protein